MVGIALWFRPGVLKCLPVLQVLWGWKVMVLPSLGKQPDMDYVMVFLCGALQQGTAAEAVR